MAVSMLLPCVILFKKLTTERFHLIHRIHIEHTPHHTTPHHTTSMHIQYGTPGQG